MFQIKCTVQGQSEVYTFDDRETAVQFLSRISGQPGLEVRILKGFGF